MKKLRTIILTFLLLLLGTGYYLGCTNSGLHQIYHLAKKVAPGNLVAHNLNGKLFSSINADLIHFDNNQVNLDIHSLKLNWNFFALLKGKLTLHLLAIDQLTIKLTSLTKTTASSSTKSNASDYFKHFDQFQFSDIRINHFTLFTPANPLPIEASGIFLSKDEDNNIAFATHLFNGNINGNLQFSPKPNLAWNLNLILEHINPGVHWKEWQGDINLNLATYGALGSSSFGKSTKHYAIFELNQLSGKLRGYTLDGKINALFENRLLTISAGNLAIGPSKLILSGNLQKNWNIKWNLSLPNLTFFHSKAQGNILIDGTIEGERYSPNITAMMRGNHLTFKNNNLNQIDGDLKLSLKTNEPFALSLKGKNLKLGDYAVKSFQTGIAGIVLKSGKEWITDFDIFLENKNYIKGKLTLPTTFQFKDYNTQPLNASFIVNYPDLSDLSDLVPHIKNLKGFIEGSVDIDGPLRKPTINANLKLKETEFNLPALGLAVKNTNLTIHNQAKALLYNANFDLNKGSASLTGSTDLASDNFSSQFKLNGTNLEVINTPEYHVFLTPDLTIALAKDNFDVEGQILIPEATIKPKDFSTTITLPEETVMVNEQDSSASPLNQNLPDMKIEIQLGKNIFLKYGDLETNLEGKVVIHKEKNNLAVASGELYAVKGSYHAYGQMLAIQEGRISYTGGLLTNPGINIKATKTIKTAVKQSTSSFSDSSAFVGTEDTIVGVQITGTATNPHVDLFSNPAGLSPTDILSYLILGYPQTQASGDESQAILGALSALNSGEGGMNIDSVTANLQNSLGLNKLNIESSQVFNPTSNNMESNTSLVVGKDLSDKFSVRYSIGLFNPTSILNLRYKLNKNWSVQTESSTLDNGADLLFSVDKD